MSALDDLLPLGISMIEAELTEAIAERDAVWKRLRELEDDREYQRFVEGEAGLPRSAYQHAAEVTRDEDPTPWELGDTTGDRTDAAHRMEQARKLK